MSGVAALSSRTGVTVSVAFVPHTDSVRGFVFDVATGRLDEVA
jgi:hypothetical protein